MQCQTYKQVCKLWVSCRKLKHYPHKQNVVIIYIYCHIYSINNREMKHDVCFSCEQKQISSSAICCLAFLHGDEQDCVSHESTIFPILFREIYLRISIKRKHHETKGRACRLPYNAMLKLFLSKLCYCLKVESLSYLHFMQADITACSLW